MSYHLEAAGLVEALDTTAGSVWAIAERLAALNSATNKILVSIEGF